MAQAKLEGRLQSTAKYRMMGCACNTARAGQGKGHRILEKNIFLQRSDHLSLLFSPTVGRRRTVKTYRASPTQLAPTNTAISRTSARNKSDCAGARCNDKEPTPNEPTRRQRTRLHTNRTATANTT